MLKQVNSLTTWQCCIASYYVKVTFKSNTHRRKSEDKSDFTKTMVCSMSVHKTTPQSDPCRKLAPGLYKLNFLLDNDGVLIIGGCLKYADISTAVKYRKLFSKKEHVTVKTKVME